MKQRKKYIFCIYPYFSKPSIGRSKRGNQKEGLKKLADIQKELKCKTSLMDKELDKILKTYHREVKDLDADIESKRKELNKL